jgi:hypothetical protein
LEGKWGKLSAVSGGMLLDLILVIFMVFICRTTYIAFIVQSDYVDTKVQRATIAINRAKVLTIRPKQFKMLSLNLPLKE